MGKQITNCSECAYVDKTGTTLWCPFHDVAVSNKLVCDDFLDEYDSPQWIALSSDIDDKQEEIPQFYPKDILMYVTTASLWLLSILFFVLCTIGGCNY